MRGHNICFFEKQEKISLTYPQYPLSPRALLKTVKVVQTVVKAPAEHSKLKIKSYGISLKSPQAGISNEINNMHMFWLNKKIKQNYLALSWEYFLFPK